MAENDFKTTLSAPGDRVMPQNVDAERAVLAAAILQPENTLQELIPRVKSETIFYRPAHQKIYTAIIELYEAGIPVDQLSLAERLKAKGELEEVGGKPYIIELATYSFALANWETHVEIILRCALLRDLIKASTRITALAYDAPDDADAVVEDAEKFIFEVTDRRVSQNFVGMSTLITKSVNMLSDLAEHKTHIVGVPTGFTDLDNILAGLRGGSMTVIAARPGVGKTSFVLNLGINAAKQGFRVGMFSLEMSAEEIMPRIISSEGGVPLKSLRSGNLQAGDWTEVYKAADRLDKLDFSIDDTPGLSILEMRAKARRFMHGCDGHGLLIVDYLQLMEPQNKRSENRNVEISEISRGLKMLAKELNIPVIALSQLSRSVESRTGKRPQLSDLRESGAIEQDADTVIFIDRSTTAEEAQSSERPDEGVARLIIAKNRSGETGDVLVTFIAHCTKFTSSASQSMVPSNYQ